MKLLQKFDTTLFEKVYVDLAILADILDYCLPESPFFAEILTVAIRG